jgi:hypothetical protein
MKYILTFYALIILMGFSCFENLELDHNTQIRVKGIVTDEAGKPLPGIPVYLEAYVSDRFIIEDYGLIQSIISDNNGSYSFMHPGSNAEFFVLHINREVKQKKENAVNHGFAEKTVLFTKKFINNYEVDLNKYGKLDSSVPLILDCNTPTDQLMYFGIKSSNDIQVDTTFDIGNYEELFHNYKSKRFFCNVGDTLNVKKNNALYLFYEIGTSLMRDTINVKDTPVFYTIKN